MNKKDNPFAGYFAEEEAREKRFRQSIRSRVIKEIWLIQFIFLFIYCGLAYALWDWGFYIWLFNTDVRLPAAIAGMVIAWACETTISYRRRFREKYWIYRPLFTQFGETRERFKRDIWP